MNFSDSDERTTEEGTPAAGSREFMTKVVCECNGKGACFARELGVRSVQRRMHVSATEREMTCDLEIYRVQRVCFRHTLL